MDVMREMDHQPNRKSQATAVPLMAGQTPFGVRTSGKTDDYSGHIKPPHPPLESHVAWWNVQFGNGEDDDGMLWWYVTTIKWYITQYAELRWEFCKTKNYLLLVGLLLYYYLLVWYVCAAIVRWPLHNYHYFPDHHHTTTTTDTWKNKL